MAISFNPTDTPLVPGGQIKFPIVAGAAPGGIVCSLPDSWTGRQRTLVFRLKLFILHVKGMLYLSLNTE